MTIASNIVDSWWTERDSSSINEKIFLTESTISSELYTLSYQRAKSTENVVCLLNNASKECSILAGHLQSIT